MSQSAQSTSAQPTGFDLDQFERDIQRSPTLAGIIVFGLPALGGTLSLLAGLPLFGALMSGCFLFAAGLVCRRAITTFTSKTLRMLVAARLVIVMVLSALLFCTTGNAWVTVVSGSLVWLVTDRLLGRRALYDLYKLTRS
jgi:hypothetical protein